MIEDSIRELKNQLLWQPHVENAEGLKARGNIILCGMGGSRFALGFLKIMRPDMDIQIWNDYGLPPNLKKDALVVVSSYSGMTEEAIGNFFSAHEVGLQIAVITSGGDLLSLAKDRKVPYIVIPSGHHPRLAAGFHLKSLVTLLGENAMRDELYSFAEGFSSDDLEFSGKAIADELVGVPMIYSSARNGYLAEYFKVSFNETSKYPAFSNVLPELAHNEISAFANSNPSSASFILIQDAEDHPRVQIKMATLESMFKEKGFKVFNISLTGSALKKIFTAYVIASWTALHLARKNNVNAEEQEIIQDFKKRVL